MRASILAGALAVSAWWCGAATASPLTCEMFKQRLHQMIDRDGNHIAQIEHYRFDGPDTDGGKSYVWDDIVGLNGSLSCGPKDEFGDFTASMPLDNGLKAIVYGRFVKLASLTTCALSSSDEPQCFEFANKMLDVGVSDLKKQVDRGEKYPVGTCDFYLFGKIDAELDVRLSSFDWSVGPGKFQTMEEARLPLDPSRRDAD